MRHGHTRALFEDVTASCMASRAACLEAGPFLGSLRSRAALNHAPSPLMPDRTYLDWPFFTDAHRALHRDVEAWRDEEITQPHGVDAFAACRAYVTLLGQAGWLKYAVPGAHG